MLEPWSRSASSSFQRKVPSPPPLDVQLQVGIEVSGPVDETAIDGESSGMYSSPNAHWPGELLPPSTRTLPDPSRVAVPPSRATIMVAVDRHESVAGSYSSLLASGVDPPPPVTRTSPEGSATAMALLRAVVSDPAGVHVPEVESYISQVSSVWDPLHPPIARTRPEPSKTRRWNIRVVDIAPVDDHVFVTGS